MNISVTKLLAKIEEELLLASSSTKEESLRERVYSIKILCELILDEKQVKGERSVTVPAMQQPVIAVPQPIIHQQTVPQPIIGQQTLNQPKKLVMDDEANGDSLFDF